MNTQTRISSAALVRLALLLILLVAPAQAQAALQTAMFSPATAPSYPQLAQVADSSSAQGSVRLPVPKLSARVTDQTDTLTPSQILALEKKMQVFEVRKGGQIAVLIVASTAPETIEQYGLLVAEAWKLGRSKVDDGALLIVAIQDRALRIEVGYGLEGALNDATSKRIISEIIVPRFAKGDFYGGIDEGLTQIIKVVDGEPLPAARSALTKNHASISSYAPILLVFALIIGRLLRVTIGKVPAALVTGGVIGVLAWFMAGALLIALGTAVLAFVLTLSAGGLMRPMLLGGVVGGGGRRSGGLGGFGGGGGSFGGGGASGRW